LAELPKHVINFGHMTKLTSKKIKPSSGSTLFFCIEPDGYTIAVARVVAHIVERRAHEQRFSIAD
jgi:hypothetical protein